VSGFQVGVAALSGPARRLKQISLDLATAGSAAATAAGSGGGAAGDPAVVSAAAVFESGVRAVLGALGDDAGLLGDKVQRAGIGYETTDSTVLPTGPGGSTAPGGTPAPSDAPTSTDPTAPFTGPSTAPAATAPTPTAPAPAAPTAGMCGAGPS
jgi:hypothetical protein